MTGERLLEAIGYIDPALVEDARRLPVRRRLGRRALTVGLAAALILALGATALAYYAGWFGDYFEKQSGGPLTESQQSYIREQTVQVGRSAAVDGWQVTVDEAVAGKNDAYIKLTVTAPEGITLDGEHYFFQENDLSDGAQSAGDVIQMGGSQGTEPDGDSHDGRVTLLLKYFVYTRPGGETSFLDGAARTLTLTDFCQFADDGTETTVAEGTWRFELTLTPRAAEQTDEVQLVDGAVPCTGVSAAWNSAGETRLADVPIELTSFRLTSMGADCEYTGEAYEALEFPDVFVTLLDGTQVRANMNTGTIGFCSFKLDAPVDLAQVDHVSVQGVELPMPGR